MKSKKRIVEEYFRKESLRLAQDTHLAHDLERDNWRALRFLAYAIQNLPSLQSIKKKLVELASIVRGGNQSESSYHNCLAEFHAIWFVSYRLGLEVTALECRSASIRSPNRRGNHSCDLLARRRSTDIYFEVKDLSSETLSQYEDQRVADGAVFFEPSSPDAIRKWIHKMLRESFKKGSDYLICRVPVWSSLGVPGFGERWVRTIFRDVKKLSASDYVVGVRVNVPSFFKGVYFISNRRHLLLKINNA